MKTKQLNRGSSPAGADRWAQFRQRAVLGSALLLAATKLAAMPSVTTVSGGPSAGNVDGDTAAVAMFNTPAGLALDKTSSMLYVADRPGR
jgi:hypothetical protein